MGRFVGTITTRQGPGDTGFTRAKVFSTPGTTTWDVPSSATKIKVFVIGAGTNYNQLVHCSNSNNCLSGRPSLGCCYCLNFLGHAMGAGGGYAEKTINAPSGTATITVGAKAASVGSTPTNSQFTLGATSVTAYSASHVNAAWSCTNNSTARDSTYDNEISYGFQFPICGYQNCLTGYWQRPGTAIGGDVNRTGGAGVVIPEFRYDSAIFPSSSPDLSSGGGGGALWCIYSCNLVMSTFGFNCYCCYFPICVASSGGGGSSLTCGINPKTGATQFPGTETQRRSLPTAGSLDGPLQAGSQYSSGGGSAPCSTIQCSANSYNYYYGGRGCWCMCAVLCTTGGASIAPATITYDPTYKKYSTKPTGLGATSGMSDKDGIKAKPETFTVTPIYDGIPSSGGGATSPLMVCICNNSSALNSCQCWLNARICNCNFCPCYCFTGAGGGAGASPPPYLDVTYIQTETALAELTGGVLQLSHLVDENGANLNNIRYGAGAGLNAATYGGGGNRTQSGGDGIVVVLY